MRRQPALPRYHIAFQLLQTADAGHLLCYTPVRSLRRADFRAMGHDVRATLLKYTGNASEAS